MNIKLRNKIPTRQMEFLNSSCFSIFVFNQTTTTFSIAAFQCNCCLKWRWCHLIKNRQLKIRQLQIVNKKVYFNTLTSVDGCSLIATSSVCFWLYLSIRRWRQRRRKHLVTIAPTTKPRIPPIIPPTKAVTKSISCSLLWMSTVIVSQSANDM